MKDILWVSIGAIFGANLRYGIARLVGKLFPHPFPVGTLIINITGSFLLGVFFMWARQRMDLDLRWRLLIAVGFCGGYTTFSSYAWETLDLAHQGNWGLAALNVAASNVLALMAVFAGAWVGQKI
jgi:fluoride exporter